jgi:hypothetical protein
MDGKMEEGKRKQGKRKRRVALMQSLARSDACQKKTGFAKMAGHNSGDALDTIGPSAALM